MKINIGSFNLRQESPIDGDHKWKNRLPRVLDELRAWSPDLLGFQEPGARELDDILSAIPEYAMVGVGRDDGIAAGEFSPILYRPDRLSVLDSGTFWLSETPETKGSRGWVSDYARICTWAHFTDKSLGISFHHYNTHLDHMSQQAREEGVSLVLTRVSKRAGTGPVIITGDFNAGPNNPAIAMVLASETPSFRDVFRTLNPNGEPSEGTYHEFTGKAFAGPIDYIFVSPEWNVLEARILHGDGAKPFVSDHFPVSATLDLSST